MVAPVCKPTTGKVKAGRGEVHEQYRGGEGGGLGKWGVRIIQQVEVFATKACKPDFDPRFQKRTNT